MFAGVHLNNRSNNIYMFASDYGPPEAKLAIIRFIHQKKKK